MIEPATPKRDRASIPLRTALLLAAAVVPLLLFAAEPDWWAARCVKAPAPPSDYAAVNQGQLKNLLRAAVDEFDAHLPGGADNFGADTRLRDLLVAWATPTAQTKDYATVNLGQAKAAMALAYTQLIRVGYTTAEANPWMSGTNANANDYAMANQGQLKHLMAFNLMATGTDGLPPWWKQYYGITDPNAIDPATGLSLSYLQEFLQGRTPGQIPVDQPASAVALEIYTPLR